jgi:hypothetical protein
VLIQPPPENSAAPTNRNHARFLTIEKIAVTSQLTNCVSVTQTIHSQTNPKIVANKTPANQPGFRPQINPTAGAPAPIGNRGEGADREGSEEYPEEEDY